MKRLLPGKRVVAVSVVLAVAAVITFAQTRSKCWGSFAYMVPIEKPVGQEDWRRDAAVLANGEERIITSHHRALDLAISPAGDRIVVAKGRGPIDDEYVGIEPVALYLYDIDESSEERLTFESRGTEPDWSPDGEKIVYFSGRAVWTVDVNSGEERKIHRFPPAHVENPQVLADATWSSDSQQIAVFTGHSEDERYELMTMNADGSDPKVILHTNDFTGNLSWSPNDKRFAWYGAYSKGPNGLYLWSKGEPAPQMVEPNASDPVWSKDGNELAYVIGHEGHYAFRIVVGRSDASGAQRVPIPDEARGGTSLVDWASC
jgi:Tol biopolymer transport system component